MPYLAEARKALVSIKRLLATEDGDWNFLYSVEFLEAFIEKPAYATIARIGKAALDPRKLAGVEALEDFLTVNGVPALDRQAARLLAFMEFYGRIGRMYEDECIKKNGDLKEYKRAEQVIKEKFAIAETK